MEVDQMEETAPTTNPSEVQVSKEDEMEKKGVLDPSKKPLEEWTKEEVKLWFSERYESLVSSFSQLSGRDLAGLQEHQLTSLFGLAGAALFNAIAQLKASTGGETGRAPSFTGREPQQTSTESNPAERSALRLLDAAFRNDYIDRGNLTNKFHQHFLDCLNSYLDNPGGYWGPYIAIFQSSGYGKSRLVKELVIRNGIYVFYISLAPTGFQTYPPRVLQEIYDAVIFSNRYPRWAIAVFLKCCLKVLVLRQPHQTPDIWYHNLDQNFVEVAKLLRHEQQTMPSNEREEEIAYQKIQSQIVDSWKFPNDMTVLFAFDEARALLEPLPGSPDTNYFLMIRRVFSDISLLEQKQKRQLFMLFADTASQISNFASVTKAEASSRSRPNTKSFPPFIHLTNVDLYRPVPFGSPITELEDILLLGRPLWKSMHRMGDPVTALIDFAKLKLRCNQEWNHMNQVERRPALIALACSRFALEVAPKAKFASTLVARSMATCLWISDSRENLYVTYPPEPVLAEAAAQEMEKSDVFVEVISEVVKSLFVGDLNLGAVGELNARILLSRAYDQIVRDKSKGSAVYSIESVTTEEFIRKLAPPPKTEDDNLSKDAMRGTVCFTNWATISYRPTPSTLVEAFNRRSALVFKIGQEGSDLLIPIKLRDRSMTAIVFQVDISPDLIKLEDQE
eukprot:TRINITY_DN4686_c0_g1_i3.p1 TRINITY_DN4686_c0_g1~~TRINITY_DN4686_c0_g1_i3.p1  ORF type:complete len:677 (-),score=68.56 TRINITY_DN4686_c0_g1_i3:911-2941(-)